jgi:hypothetical protein
MVRIKVFQIEKKERNLPLVTISMKSETCTYHLNARDLLNEKHISIQNLNRCS